MAQVDSILGADVHAHLLSIGVETPMDKANTETEVSKRALIESHFAEIMKALGLDLTDDSLIDTPRRVAKMYVDEIFYGLNYNLFPKCTTVDNKMHYNEMVLTRATVQSSCEHHFITISGKATVAYIPKTKVIGLSKINRIVDFFAKRPQIQERLTEQIFHALCFILDTDNVAVIVDAEHFCVKARGVRDVNSSTVTARLGGSFLASPVRAEFLSYHHNSGKN